MKKLLVLALALCTLGANAQDFPKPSPLAKTYQKVGFTDVEVEYSSPAVRDRNIFYDVVKVNELWRTGANGATIFSVSEAITFGDIDVPAGSYALFSIPGEKSIQFMLNTDTEQSGTGSYDPKLTIGATTTDFVKVKGQNVERLRFTIQNATSENADFVMEWADRKAVVKMKMNTRSQAGLKLKQKSVELESTEFRMYSDAANYYLEIGDGANAVMYGEKSVKMDEKFWNTHTLAKAYSLNGQKDKAVKMARVSMELSQKANYKAYIEKNEKLLSELEK